MRTILTLSAVVVLAAACAPGPHPYPVAEAPYLLHVPAPGTDYRYRSGPQGFGRTGPVYTPGLAYQPPAPQEPPPGYGGYGYGYEAPRVRGASDSYSWGDRRHSVRGGSSYESREMMTEETYVTGGVIVEREGPRAPHRPAPYPDTSGYQSYPGPYAESPQYDPRRVGPSRFDAPRAGPTPAYPTQPQPPQPRPPYPDAGPEPFY